MELYSKWMIEEGKNSGTTTTRYGRMRVFFCFLHEKNCKSIARLTSSLLLVFIQELRDKYTSQGKANILYTLRNFFSCPDIQKELRFEPLLLLYGIHSRKHERLASYYTPDEIRCVMNAVDRGTQWEKAIYLMMLLACVYGLRASDIREMRQSSIHWKQQTISLYQQKTKRYVELPLTENVLLALLDYLKNARPNIQDPHLFIRLRAPHTPYSPHDHFGSKVTAYFEKYIEYKRGKGEKVAHSTLIRIRDLNNALNRYERLEITASMIEEFLAPDPKISPHTRYERISQLRQFSGFLRALGIKNEPVSSRYTQAVCRRFRSYIFSQEELERLSHAADTLPAGRRSNNHGRVYPVIIRILIGTGMRISEVT